MPFMVRLFDSESRTWVLRKLSRHLARHGKVHFVNLLSDLSVGNVWIMSETILKKYYKVRYRLGIEPLFSTFQTSGRY